jgi:hypothetical protein
VNYAGIALLVQRLGLGACLLGPSSGCHGVFWWKHDAVAEQSAAVAGISSTPAAPTVKRRMLVVSRSPQDFVVGPHLDFAQELVAALNTSGGFEAILAPPEMPIPCPGEGEPPAITPAGGPVAGVDYDEILVVEVTEIRPYPPLRLSAVLERRAAADGQILSRSYRTWNGPVDMQPLYPHPFTRKALWHPAPLGEVEQNELSRLSPHTFFRNVAADVVREIAGSPR